jgi:hypothetical protein
MILLLLACHGSSDDTDGGETDGEPTREPVVANLADAPATIVGNLNAELGYNIAFAGDLTGDGRQSLAVVAYPGTLCIYDPDIGLDHLQDDAVGCYQAESTTVFAGGALAAGHDVTGDGEPDVLVGAVGASDAGANAGAIYLLAAPYFGGPMAGGFARFDGEEVGDQAGISVAYAGDVDDDGNDDLLLGAWGNDEGGLGGGKAYLFRGPITAGTHSLAEAESAIVGVGQVTEFHDPPPEGDGCGSALAGAGDTDADGLPDLALGVNGSDLAAPDAGLVAFFAGPVANGTHPLADADRTFTGGTYQEYVGDVVVAVGDLDGDGRADVLAGGDNWVGAGRAWLIPGDAPSGPLDALATRFDGEAVGDWAGAVMSPAGDIDADGERDVAFAAYQADGVAPDSGRVYLFYGPMPTGANPLAEAPVIWEGAAGGNLAGRALAGGADVDGDGGPDLAVGAIGAPSGSPPDGKVYVLFAPGG